MLLICPSHFQTNKTQTFSGEESPLRPHRFERAPQGGEKMGANLQGKVVSAPHPRGKAKVQFLRKSGRFGRWERLLSQF